MGERMTERVPALDDHRRKMNPRDAVLVTGGAGFIGSHVSERLLNLTSNLVVIDNLSGGSTENVPKRATFIKGDISDSDLIDSIFEEYSFKYVYHFAAYASESVSHLRRVYTYNKNITGSAVLINAAINFRVKHFIFSSSIAVYGHSHGNPVNEETRPEPIDPYGISKLAVEMDISAADRLFGMPYTVFRLHNVYGKRQNMQDAARNVVAIFTNQALRGEPLTIYGDGHQRRCFTSIDDIAPLLATAPFDDAARNQIINLGTRKSYSILQLAEFINTSFGRDNSHIQFLPDRDEVVNLHIDHDKAVSIYGNRDETQLENGITQLVLSVNDLDRSNFSSLPPTEIHDERLKWYAERKGLLNAKK